mgnify:CR=1 FL=1
MSVNNSIEEYIRGFRHAFHHFLGSYEVLFPLFSFKLLVFSREALELLPKPTDEICITGPARSANTFLTKSFMMWNPSASVAHHMHVPIMVARAAKWNIPCVVLLRLPEDALTSALAAEDMAVNFLLFSYTNFYRTIERYLDKILILTFEDATQRPEVIRPRLERKFQKTFHALPLTDAERQSIFSTIRKNGKRKKKYLIAIPDEEKEKRKAEVKEHVLSHRLYPNALEVYIRWSQFEERQFD